MQYIEWLAVILKYHFESKTDFTSISRSGKSLLETDQTLSTHANKILRVVELL